MDNPIETLIRKNLTKFSSSESDSLEGEISLHELSEALKNMKNEKSPGMDGFYCRFILIFLNRFKNFCFEINKLWLIKWLFIHNT